MKSEIFEIKCKFACFKDICSARRQKIKLVNYSKIEDESDVLKQLIIN